MNVRELQALIGTTVDGNFGPKSREALIDHFTNTNAPAVNHNDLVAFASNIGCSVEQLKAVAAVESAGSGFDNQGRPKILFERHLFHRMTNGKWSPAIYSQPKGGGYRESSWDKLGFACAKDVDAAFAACSWGKFQVLGMHWSALGFHSPYALARSCIEDEGAHYDLLARYILHFGLERAVARISTDEDDNRAFAHGFNGPAYARFSYHTKLAEAMERLA